MTLELDDRQAPIRAEVYGIERLEEHARELANADKVSIEAVPGFTLMARVEENRQGLARARDEFNEAFSRNEPLPAAAEWLLDNFYVVEEQIQEVRRDLTPQYYQELPRLVNGPYTNYPRVYGLAFELIAHTDSHIDARVLKHFVRAYQQVTTLTSGELWAIPIMLRFGLVENLRRLIDIAVRVLHEREAADQWADRLLLLCKRPATELFVGLEELTQGHRPLAPAFTLRLFQRLHDQDPAIAPAIEWLEKRMAEEGHNVDSFIREENQQRTVNRVSVGNSVTTMRFLDVLDWPQFFENTSVVESILCEDPSGVYPHMDLHTRDRYRHVIERLSRHSKLSEAEVAQKAIALAARARDGTRPALETHVGYYLIEAGLEELAEAIGFRPYVRHTLTSWVYSHATLFYLGLIGIVTTALLAGTLFYAVRAGANPAQLVLAALLALFPLSALSVGSINWTITVEAVPNTPPKLDFKEGIPPEHRTMVVAPALVSSLSGVEFLLENLERRFLANRDENLAFAVLADWGDAPHEQMPEDMELHDALVLGIRALNDKYERADAFFLFMRKRKWNPAEGAWIGWERKRGNLVEFNRLLRGAQDTSYSVQIGELAILPKIRYLIVLDADTELPLSVARRLVGAIAHPLNRPVVDPKSGRVVSGYGTIQPRMDVVAPAAVHSRFAQVFTGDAGLDPYSSVVSNVYQDLFQTSIFVGKGIYDVDATLAVLDNRFPENTVLSHDLVEGTLDRTGLASDIELLEDFPSTFAAFTQRQHRWIRGDWQILEWLGRRVRDASGRTTPNPLPLIERWKIFDNLRRSLVPPFAILLLLAGWTLLPGSPAFWTGLALLTIAFPFVRSILSGLGVRPPGEPIQHYLVAIAYESSTALLRAVLTISFLLYQAVLNSDAIIRALLRRYVTHHHLLEWTTQWHAEYGQTPTLPDYLRRMWWCPILSLVLAVGIVWQVSEASVFALPFCVLWFVSPFVAFYVSQPLEKEDKPLPENAREELAVLARRIWGYFERFAGAEDHWLPPDNFQVEPKSEIAHRTSPTNIGFLILSTIAAYDFGFIGRCALVGRMERVLDTLERLECYRGHFLNWYDTLSAQPLYPQYVSTVDSGNLAACLITLQQTCEELIEGMAPSRSLLHGLNEVTSILSATVSTSNFDGKKPLPKANEIRAAIGQIRSVLAAGERAPSPILRDRIDRSVQQLDVISAQIPSNVPVRAEVRFWVERLSEQVAAWHTDGLDHNCTAGTVADRLRAVAQRCRTLVDGMDFAFLYSAPRGVFAIGYNVTNNRLDDSYYDLLASEERLTSFIAVARGQVPERHWFRLSRPLTRAAGRVALLSWGGTMFEYLMPPLLMQDVPNTLLYQTNRAIVQKQINYATARGVPWGISESGFNAFDYQTNYQYRLFGVPDLGLKRETTDNLVIAPYATLLALPVAPQAVWTNLQSLAEAGGIGDLGYYEALDYTPSRVPRGQKVGVVREYMAHHQGMALVALDNYLNDEPMRRRFLRDPAMAAASVLLQERIPHHTPFLETAKEDKPVLRAPEAGTGSTLRQFSTASTPVPRAHLLSNGDYSVVVTNAGGGYSAYGEIELTRWRQDQTSDDWGSFIYVRNVDNGEFWSAAFQPTRRAPDQYQVVDALDRVEFRRRDAGIECRTEILVAPDKNVEIRRLTLTNHNLGERTLELTSYAEVVLETHRADVAHPAFSKLFVESEFDQAHQALLFKRRPRASDQPALWAVHLMASSGHRVHIEGYETDRSTFLGRGGTVAAPLALTRRLTSTAGASLDPIMSLRTQIRLPGGEGITLAFVTGVATSRDQALELCAQFSDPRNIERTTDLAQAHSQVQLRHLGITPQEAILFQRLASRVLYPETGLRAPEAIRSKNVRGQPNLWPYGISGDYPIVLVKIANADDVALVHRVLLAHEYWRMNNLKTDLVIVNEHPATYAEEVQGRVQGMIDTSLAHPWVDKPGGVFLRRRDHIAPEDYILIQTVARVVLDASLGTLEDQLVRSRPAPVLPLPARRPAPPRAEAAPSQSSQPSAGLYPNGLGGFSPDGREYIITLGGNRWTPRPWINVLANSEFGCLVSEGGPGMAWSLNSQENKLSPWSNDPVSDSPSQMVYLFDEESHALWSPTPLPIREPEPYIVHHGAGYTRFEHVSHDIEQELIVFIARQDPIELVRLKLTNRSPQTRHLRATFYVPWVCGVTREATQFTILTEQDSSGAILAHNSYNPEFNTRRAFAAASETLSGLTTDRTEFLGRNGLEAYPAALAPNAPRLSGRSSGAADPCAVLQVRIDLRAGEEKVVCFHLGEGRDADQVRGLLEQYRSPGRVEAELKSVRDLWDGILNTIEVTTPDPALDLLLNRWLLYQVLSCRVWARSAFYQAGGAYGFRDQLQDAMALVWSAPELTREQILRAAAHQFLEGDVMHWWHPPGDKGVRTRISDDYLWLPFVTDYYIETTGDATILDETVRYIKMAALSPGQDEMYGEPEVAESGTLYEHCLRALDHGLRFGEHGLPLMGTGDWNDGMNSVGDEGKGESVWLGWFLYANLVSFASRCQDRGDMEHAAKYREQAQTLQKALEENAWDGQWYRRAYFDDGTPLGSTQNVECKIDAIAQAWSVLSGAAAPERQQAALKSVEDHLVKEQDAMILLLTPPFDNMHPNPGYIQGYLPGIRENGGQYTHGVLWLVLAYIKSGNGDRAAELLTLLNPLHHALNPEGVERYKVEPYVVAADVYAHPQHLGQGGWTWYTGSAAWMYRIAVEGLLGIKRRGDHLFIDPCIPRSWPHYEVTYRVGSSQWHIRCENPDKTGGSVTQVELDGKPLEGPRIPLVDDGQTHQVSIVLH